jgi:ankyrin repeat protein
MMSVCSQWAADEWSWVNKQRMTEMADLAEEDFQPLRPSRSGQFSTPPLDAIRSALQAMASGNVMELEQLLQKHPALVDSSGFDATQEGTYFHGAALLHYVTGNPTDHPVPKNAAEVTRLLLRSGADPNSMTDVGNNTPLCLMASSKPAREAGVQTELIDILIEAGAEVDASDGLAIYAVLAHGETKASRALYHHGARLDLRFAAGLGEIGVMESFLTAAGTLKTDARRSHSRRPYYERNVGVTKDSAPDADTSELPRMTDSEILAEALAYAMVNQQLEAMRWLLDHGADPNVKPTRFHGGQSVLHLACSGLGDSDTDVVKMLLDAGADANDNDPESTGATPLQWAVHNGQPAPISMLLECTDGTAADHVHYALKCLAQNDAKQRARRLAVIEALLEGSATPAVARGDGRTVAGVVEESGDAELQDLIER